MSPVFLFPGQGSQSKGMLADMLAAEPVVQQSFAEASDVLGYDMVKLVLDDVDGKLDQTEFTQPALLTASTAMLRLWNELGGATPAQVAGHSLGEYSALVAAGSLAFSDALSLVAFRGQVMSKAVPAGVGKMAAIIGLDDAIMSEICASVSTETGQVWPANFNCPGQLVIAGHAGAVDIAMDKAREAGAKRALPLAVSAPSHTPLMQAAADAMRQKLVDIPVSSPLFPVWSNARAAALDSADEIRAALVEQLVQPVRWTEIVTSIAEQGHYQVIEMGPGKVLAGLVRRIDRQFNVHSPLTRDLMEASIRDLADYAGGNHD
ncbi:MAG: [acyl-carrier-protein] S-malonyltransferase [Zetaproteobacteria bacterium CG_4_9_14_3_um_filter_49_83]|nr:MAG: [acyl-carrier-protein] S-malonyltransferase [Zetaproteobacteria bacterium CG1_02_49_23]PIQ32748.1 MAG: [acyl-carrier-protein] S-malonyltransferase [Zetaproteobacteria bacterium CG17_big_fil_post_rev_8_21_14_2_50_50_13]PIV29613.1 MAG: [acyl-carrier-protein] S-malonyltransferase [Zetaproteobacteria bacterium CG02_land_8_20_14_3_00_50_9]PIY54939.1 MAG: [acyl-carrier-protein] S-malonyltransferase [Zetaproteobacteria bacterium CG_4_10_14_0_8_um_filter_49_80]PJA35317.1 MAG: [acyl-carrier-prot